MDSNPEGGRLAPLVTVGLQVMAGLLVAAGLLAALVPVLARAGQARPAAADVPLLGHQEDTPRPAPASADALGSYARARASLEAAVAAIGGRDDLARAGGVARTATGTLGKTAERPGLAPDVPSPGSFRETLAVDPARRSAAREYREEQRDGDFGAQRARLERIYTMHGSGLVTAEHLARLAVDGGSPREDGRAGTPGTARTDAERGAAAGAASPGSEQDIAAAGAIRIVVPDHPVEAGGPELPLVEPRPAVNPDDPDHLVVGTIVAAPDRRGPWHCAALTSFDGGDTWSRSELGVERCIDPWVEFTPEGVLVTAIEIGGEDRGFRLLGFRSSDGGRTWTDAPVPYGDAFDHEVLTVDPDGRMFMAARRDRSRASGRPRHTLWIARSDDGGRSFRELAELEPSTLSLSPTGVAVDGDTIVAGFRDSQRDVDGFRGEGMLARARSWVVRSEDGGTTFSPPMLVTDACASGIEGAFPGYPYLDGDPGGRLYHVCVRPGLDGIALTRSVDGGERWAHPVRVDGGPGDSHVRTPMLAVGEAGPGGVPAVAGIAWFDRRDDPGCQRLWFTASTDGGESVLEPVEVSTEPSCPARGDNGRVAESWSMGGDYSSLAAGPDGRFHVVWADSRSGRFRLRHAVLQVEKQERVEG